MSGGKRWRKERRAKRTDGKWRGGRGEEGYEETISGDA